MTVGRRPRNWLRAAAGIAVSALFLALTLSRVNLEELGLALGRVSPVGLLLTLPLVAIELVLRATRWQRLLARFAVVPLRLTAAYLTIGYLANSILPARLGDVARAHLAGRAFGIGRLSVLGTILVERVADGAFILMVVAVLGLIVAGGASLAMTAVSLGLLGVVGLAILAAGVAWLRRSDGRGIRGQLRSFVDRILEGVAVLREPAVATSTALLTVLPFAVAVGTFALVASAAGAELTLPQCALIMGTLALSTSIPAGPGSIGTYEFVGLTIMTALGLSPEVSLAVALLVHLVVTVPVAIAGLAAAWQLHFRISDISATSEPGPA